MAWPKEKKKEKKIKKKNNVFEKGGNPEYQDGDVNLHYHKFVRLKIPIERWE